MKIKEEGLIINSFSQITDPRTGNATKHKLIDIIVLAISSIICGAEGWEDMEEFSKAKLGYFSQFLSLLNTVLLQTTPSDVFFQIWIQKSSSRLFPHGLMQSGKPLGEKLLLWMEKLREDPSIMLRRPQPRIWSVLGPEITDSS